VYKISIINMPFATVSLPSIALTQLKSVVEEKLGDQVRVRILYFNHDFAHFVGAELYGMMTNSMEANNSGLGDWFFRQAAFPETQDNTQQYFKRYFPHVDEEIQVRKGQVLAKRAALKRFMNRLIMKYRLDGEDMIGLTSMFAQNVACFAMAKAMKDRKPGIVTVMGGANCEAPMGAQISLHVEAVDFVASGPGLVTFPQLLDHLLAGETEKCHEIRGVFSKKNTDPVQLSSHLGSGMELPIEVPVKLDFDSFLADLDHNFPNGQVAPSLTFETSRGCWWGELSHCTFCGLNGSTMAYRGMPSEQALELFDELFTKYGDRCKRFESVDNILPRQYLTEVMPKIKTPEGAVIFYEVKADLKDWEMETLAKAGVTQIQPGIESLNTSTLKLMGKGTTSFQNVNFLKNCIQFGIAPMWNLLIGFPRESEEVYAKYLEDMPQLMHLTPPAGAFPVRFDRFSPYFVKAKEFELDLSPYEFYGFIYPFPEESLAQMAYYFQDRNYEAKYLVEMIAWQERLNAGVAHWRARWDMADGGLKPRLSFEKRGATTVVHDTRSGESVVHEVGRLTLEVLEQLHAKGKNLRFLSKHVEVGEEALAEEVARLVDLGLLFEEDGRYISLVLAEDRPATVFDGYSSNAVLEARDGFTTGAGADSVGA